MATTELRRSTSSEIDFWALQRDAFLISRNALATGAWASATGDLDPECGLHRRLLDAAAGVESGETGAADVAALVGAVLRREAARPNRVERASLLLPIGGRW